MPSIAPKPSSDPTLLGRTVLVVEDHPDSRELLRQVLKSLRANVLTASTLEDAERQLSLARVHLVVCDMKLPDGTGLELVQWLRSQGDVVRKIPCLGITGYERFFPPNSARGFDAYMRKPINLDRFCNIAVTLATQR
jgi:CheY-like chemotaxis protein